MFNVIKGITLCKQDKIQIGELENCTSLEAAEKIADYFTKVSNEYEPVNLLKLPCYLPAPPPPRVTEEEIFERLKKLKNTKSTYLIDLPNKLRNEFGIFLTLPLKDIINSSFVKFGKLNM